MKSKTSFFDDCNCILRCTYLLPFFLILLNSFTNAANSSSQILSVDQQLEALDTVLNITVESAYEAYNVSISDLSDESAAQSIRFDIIEDADGMPHHDFYFLLNKMLGDLYQDAHFRVEVTDAAATEYCYLDLCLIWLQNGTGLVNNCSTENAEIGDEIVSIGGVTPAEMFDLLQTSIPHENTYFLEGLPQSWLVREDFLAYFGARGVNSDEVVVNMKRNGNVLPGVTLTLAVRSVSDGPDDPSFVSFNVYAESSTAVFKLDACVFNDEFTSTLADFWNTVHASEVEAVVLDLRSNRGGNAAVIPAFLSHLDAPAYTLFAAVQRQSEAFCAASPMFCDTDFLAQFGIDGTMEKYEISSSIIALLFSGVVGPPPDTKFSGAFYVLTSGTTFSSANLFAMVIQDNGLGKVVGTPTGNALNFHGNVLSFPVPHTNLTLYLTTALNLREELPNISPLTDAVHPDVLVPTTVEDIIAGVDPQLQWVLDQHSPKVVSQSPTSSPTKEDTPAPSPALRPPTPTPVPTSAAPTVAPTPDEDTSAAMFSTPPAIATVLAAATATLAILIGA